MSLTAALPLRGSLTSVWQSRDRSVPVLALGEWKEDMGEGNGEDQNVPQHYTRELGVWPGGGGGFGKWEFEAGVFSPFCSNSLHRPGLFPSPSLCW